ncbi:MAG: DUF3467 domain-containing protein [Anaerolineae bacterium CG_4_9_14_3_um_filter_57_17]|nr:DUF3467 domain-containing protein [bacterium]NCT21933.1 DUF3467 domain-containing protein [bacterium]OIO85175.1 MAG: hypothetical protein AUK01_06755 [Anaerolineae bacterium CG2_30_57_67]PJB64112.1 MAG: DUF3467 domain-containing protein [Anaerolineae bacterium CG_4_9_14_3_um_filter_57_17]
MIPVSPNQNRPSTTIEAPADLKPVYSNLVRIAHSPADVVLDFAHLMPGETRARIAARVLMSPLSAKLLLRALAENIARYEAAFGEITLPASSHLADQLFKPAQQPPDPDNPSEEGQA